MQGSDFGFEERQTLLIFSFEVFRASRRIAVSIPLISSLV